MSEIEATDREGQQARRELERRIGEFGQAWASSDIAKLEDLLASEYLHTDFLGRVFNRNEWLAYAKSFRPVDRIEFEDVEMRLYGDVAVVTGKNVIRGQHNSGQQSSRESNIDIRFTQVWVRENGEWKRAYFQATPVVEQSPA